MQKIKKIIVYIILIQSLGLGAQNLVPNPSFETYTACPSGFSQINKATSWYGTNNDSELYNSCAMGSVNVPNTAYGYQQARTGNAFAGQYFLNGYGTNYREYIQSWPFTSSLVSGNCYLVKFYVNVPDKTVFYGCNNIAANISVLGYTTTGSPATTYTPQIYLVNNPIIKDTLNWVEIGGIYTASGGENHITIGNFKNDASTDTMRVNNGTYGAAYYYIDDVSVQQITTPTWQLRDTTISSGDSVIIGPLYSGLTCNWYDMSGTPIGSGAAFWVKPTSTTSYVLKETICNTIYSDTIIVHVNPLGIKENNKNGFKTNVYPNPTTDVINIEFLNAVYKQETAIEISDLTGRVVYITKQQLSSNSLVLHPDLNSGTYLVKVKLSDGTTDMHRLVISK